MEIPKNLLKSVGIHRNPVRIYSLRKPRGMNYGIPRNFYREILWNLKGGPKSSNGFPTNLKGAPRN